MTAPPATPAAAAQRWAKGWQDLAAAGPSARTRFHLVKTRHGDGTFYTACGAAFAVSTEPVVELPSNRCLRCENMVAAGTAKGGSK
jgi:hypothetical protein